MKAVLYDFSVHEVNNKAKCFLGVMGMPVAAGNAFLRIIIEYVVHAVKIEIALPGTDFSGQYFLPVIKACLQCRSGSQFQLVFSFELIVDILQIKLRRCGVSAISRLILLTMF